MTQSEYYEQKKAFVNRFFPYVMCHHTEYNYGILHNILNIRRAGQGKNESYNQAIIMIDTETSKKDKSIVGENHVVAWTISIRAFDRNMCTLWGHKPSTLVDTILTIHNTMEGDNTIIYCHNWSYDYVFLRKFLFEKMGHPSSSLNTKAHYPVNMRWDNGIQIRDSLILAQRSLDKWAKDMKVEHQKAVGKWDYDKIRNQDEEFTKEELEYIEHDTLAGVECIQKTKDALNKRIYAIPLTATGIPREEVQKRGKENRAHDRCEKMLPDDYFEQLLLETVYHGGYAHANRHYINVTFRATRLPDGSWDVKTLIKCKDFASSYPYQMLTMRAPAEKFTSTDDCNIQFILDNSEKYAYIFKLILYKVKLKDDFVSMPTLQLSKCTKVVNPVLDNGRILCASYIEIYLNEIDLSIIASQYTAERHICTDVRFAYKDYLPRWFTNYVFELFADKCKLKGGDPVLYALAKAKLNSLYGLTVQKPVRCNLIEDYITGEYAEDDNADMEELFQKYKKKKTTVLPYVYGIWVTSNAMAALFRLAECINYDDGGIWIYSDTDSIYATNWDEKKVEAFNNEVKQKLIDRGYGAVVVNNKEYWLGVAEADATYYEYRVQGAKRYCGRSLEDDELHITVAGVPKKGAKCLNDNIDNFAPGMVFDGKTTGKKTHTYFYVEEIYTDENGNETGDSIDLSKCDYLLSSVDQVDWEHIFNEEIQIQVYGEDDV